MEKKIPETEEKKGKVSKTKINAMYIGNDGIWWPAVKMRSDLNRTEPKPTGEHHFRQSPQRINVHSMRIVPFSVAFIK